MYFIYVFINPKLLNFPPPPFCEGLFLLHLKSIKVKGPAYVHIAMWLKSTT